MDCSGSPPPRISILLPTRGRPELAAAFLDSLAGMARDPSRVEVILYVDEDDPASAVVGDSRLRVTAIVGPHATMGAMNTACLARASADIVMLANDDVVVRTPEWDVAIECLQAKVSDQVYLAWPNDRFASNRMSTFPILSRTTCRLLVSPFPEEYRSAFIDYELFDIFTRLRRLGHDRLLYLDQVVFEHWHHRTGKRAVDTTSRRRPRFEDDLTFLDRRGVRQQHAARLAAAVDGREPRVVGTVATRARPAHGVAAVWHFATSWLGDSGLPLRRRLYLFTWYCGRWVAAQLGRRHAHRI